MTLTTYLRVCKLLVELMGGKWTDEKEREAIFAHQDELEIEDYAFAQWGVVSCRKTENE